VYKHSKAVVVKLLFLPEHAVLSVLTVWGGEFLVSYMSANVKKCAVSQGILSEAFVEERRPTIVVRRH